MLRYTGGTMEHAESRTPLTDSLLHTHYKRVVVGVFCGIISGLLLLFVTSLFTPAGASKLWWLQLTGSMFFGGNAMAYDASQKVILAGLLVHFAVAALCGLIVGKATTTRCISTLMIYGVVLGG